MSIDTYFCLCCLSTDDLTSIFTNDSEFTETTYESILEDLFAIKLSQDECDDDSYLCRICESKLKNAYKFKIQVSETLNVLQVNGLIAVEKNEENQCLIKKLNVESADLEEKYSIKDNTEVDNYVLPPKPDQLFKQEDPDLNSEEYNKGEIITNINENKRKLGTRKTKKKVKRELQSEDSDVYKCKICGAVLPNVYVYHSHINEHFPNHICETCGKVFLTEKKLKRHIPSHKSGPFKCENCDEEFANYNTLNSHRQRKHGTALLYKCPQCPERFNSYVRRAIHLSKAHARSEGKHECTICKKRFLIAGGLRTHMRATHMGVKRHYCSQCGVGFFQKEDLRGHMTSHTGVKDFQCSMCPKRYLRKKALMVHMRTHTNDRRFCCDVCGKKFLQKCTLMTHLKTHNRSNANIRSKGDNVAESDLNKEL